MEKHLWLRAETKAFERRTPLTPVNAEKLIAAGIKVSVEYCPNRIFPIEQYEKIGCEIVEFGSFRNAPRECYILGLKELPNDLNEFSHQHIYFAHAYKGQEGAGDLLQKFNEAGGKLFDLEYLIDENSRRIAAFGKWAGLIGTAIAIDCFYHKQITKEKYPQLSDFEDHDDLINQIKIKKEQCTIHPDILIIGANGRCGSGALETIHNLDLKATKWDTTNTKKGGPFNEILDHHIFVNTVLITKKINPFITKNMVTDLDRTKWNLDIIADVSCDPSSELNPVPLYDNETTWKDPFLSVESVDILAVDNLPSILPKESSMDFSSQLQPYLVSLLTNGPIKDSVWDRSLKIFNQFKSK